MPVKSNSFCTNLKVLSQMVLTDRAAFRAQLGSVADGRICPSLGGTHGDQLTGVHPPAGMICLNQQVHILLSRDYYTFFSLSCMRWYVPALGGITNCTIL
jgi:hypothetical protein